MSENEKDPIHHVQNIQRMMTELIDHLRGDISKIDEPKAQVLFETSAEVLIGLKTAFEHYRTEAEPAMTR